MSTAAIVTTILQLVGVLLIAAGLVVTSRRETEAQDTAIVISLGQDYRRRWETTGRQAVDRLEQHGDTPSAEDQVTLLSILNWIDWLGVLIRDGAFRKPRLILDTVGPSMARVLTLAYSEIEVDSGRHGPNYWSGVLEVGRRLALQGALDSRAFPLFANQRVQGAYS